MHENGSDEWMNIGKLKSQRYENYNKLQKLSRWPFHKERNPLNKYYLRK